MISYRQHSTQIYIEENMLAMNTEFFSSTIMFTFLHKIINFSDSGLNLFYSLDLDLHFFLKVVGSDFSAVSDLQPSQSFKMGVEKWTFFKTFRFFVDVKKYLAEIRLLFSLNMRTCYFIKLYNIITLNPNKMVELIHTKR